MSQLTQRLITPITVGDRIKVVSRTNPDKWVAYHWPSRRWSGPSDVVTTAQLAATLALPVTITDRLRVEGGTGTPLAVVAAATWAVDGGYLTAIIPELTESLDLLSDGAS